MVTTEGDREFTLARVLVNALGDFLVDLLSPIPSSSVHSSFHNRRKETHLRYKTRLLQDPDVRVRLVARANEGGNDRVDAGKVDGPTEGLDVLDYARLDELEWSGL